MKLKGCNIISYGNAKNFATASHESEDCFKPKYHGGLALGEPVKKYIALLDLAFSSRTNCPFGLYYQEQVRDWHYRRGSNHQLYCSHVSPWKGIVQTLPISFLLLNFM